MGSLRSSGGFPHICVAFRATQTGALRLHGSSCNARGLILISRVGESWTSLNVPESLSYPGLNYSPLDPLFLHA